MKRIAAVTIALSLIALAGCSKGTSVPGGGEATPAEAASPQNSTAFPLGAEATVISSKAFSQTVTPGQAGTGAMSAGAGTYSGTEVIASSNSSLADLEKWLRDNEQQPPKGLVTIAMPASMAKVHTVATQNGMDFAIFHDASNNKHGLVVIALDPEKAHNKLGPALALVSKYQALPPAMRQGIDSQLKNRYGYTASEFVEPGSPLGSAVGALSDFHNKNQRAVIIIDATKQ